MVRVMVVTGEGGDDGCDSHDGNHDGCNDYGDNSGNDDNDGTC